MNSKIVRRIEPLLGIALIIMLWELTVIVLRPFFLASPQETLYKIIELFSNGSVFKDILSTMEGTLTGLFFGSLFGIILGMIMGYYFRSYRISALVIDFLRSIPAMALFPLFLIIFGIGNESKIALIIFTITWIMLINSVYGVRYTSKIRKKIARLHGAGFWELILNIIFPEALPHIFAGLRIAVSISLVLMISFEMLFGASYGLGQRIYDSSQTYRISELYASIFISGCCGYILNKFVLVFEKKYLHWIRQV